VTAVHAWGFGFYGLSVFVARLRSERGWSNGLVSGSTIALYLDGAMLITRVPWWWRGCGFAWSCSRACCGRRNGVGSANQEPAAAIAG